jgi:hypothetical protein
MRGELQSLKDAVAKSNTESEQAATTARYVILPPTYAPVFFSFADWYHVESSPRNSARLRRLLRAAGGSPVEASPEDQPDLY